MGERRMQIRLSDSEYKLMEIIWEKEPVSSTELSKLCLERFEWKKSTVYTMLKRLTEKQALSVSNAMVLSTIKKDVADRMESEALLEKSFGGSLPDFFAAFLQDRKLTKEDASRLQEMIKEASK